ncbi:hypothetical protein [Ramlibacter sp.]|uniref:hypothetical protein n=1 Tax=Ramlibacter sp. TaxID=1917967 RepID=UPI002FC9F0CC
MKENLPCQAPVGGPALPYLSALFRAIMTLTRYLPLVLLLPLLSACEPKVEPVKVKPEKVVPAAVEEVAKPLAASPAPAVQAPAAVPKAPQAKVATPAAAAAARPKAVKPEVVEGGQDLPKTKLDLSLPPELAEQLKAEDGGAEAALAPLLPPLFEQKRPVVNPFQLSGRLITNEHDEDYWNSVEGAEVQFEFKR